MTAVQPRSAPARSAPLGDTRHRGARSILIRTVPRAALEALVARLIAEGVGHGG